MGLRPYVNPEPLVAKTLSRSGIKMMSVQLQAQGDAVTDQSCKIKGRFK